MLTLLQLCSGTSCYISIAISGLSSCLLQSSTKVCNVPVLSVAGAKWYNTEAYSRDQRKGTMLF
jgi:hypothetical protein